MDYRHYVDQVMKLSFINDEMATDQAIRTVLGAVARTVGDEEAQRLTELLPPELNLGNLSGQQRRPVPLSFEDFIMAVAGQFQVNWQEARELVFKVFHCVKESSEGVALMETIRMNLPPDWAEVVDRA